MASVRLASVVLGACALGTLALVGCNKETPPAAEEPRSASNAAAPLVAPSAAETTNNAPAAAAAAAPAEPAAAGVAKVTDPSFDVSLEAPKAPLKAGQAGSVEVLLVAKAPFHVNDKYPIKMKLKETPGVKYASLVVGKDAAKVENMKATLPVSFTPEAGKRQIAGQFLFSVCTDDKCLMEKRDLALDVQVD
jgi:hypothetical protein